MNEQDQYTNLDEDAGSGDGFGLEFMLGAFFDTKIKPAIDTMGEPKAFHPTVFGTVVTDGTSPFIVPVASPSAIGPAAGKLWSVRTVGLYGKDAHTAVTSTAVEFYAGDVPDAGGATMPPIGPVMDNFGPGAGSLALTIPCFISLPEEVVWCQHGESIYALVYGVATGNQLTIVANVALWDLSDKEPMSG